jgi:hypothetical protein
MTLPPDRNTSQHQGANAQRNDDRNLGHGDFLRSGFIDFDDIREFDFSLIPARPRLRLVISNSSPVSVKA